MTDTETQPRAVKFSRLARRGILLGLSGPQLNVLGVAALLLVAALYSGGNAVAAAIPVLAVLIAVAFAHAGGRPLTAWAPIAWRWARRTITGQLEFRARIGQPRPTGTLALPGDAARLREYLDPQTGAAYVHDPHAGTLTAVVQVTHPGFVLLDPTEQDRRVTAWGRALATACRTGRIASVQILGRTLPDSGKSLADWWHTHGTRDGSWAAQIYEQLVDRAGPAGQRHASTISIAIDTRTASRAIRAAGGGLRGAAAVLRHELDTMTMALAAADITATAPLGPGDLAIMLRTAYDPAVAATLERHGDLGRDLATAGPLSVTESWGHLRSDSAYHAVLWISEWPRTLVSPAFLQPLLTSTGVQHAFTLLFTPVRADLAARDLRKKKTEYISEAAQRARIGQIEDATQTAEYTDVLQQEADLTTGHGLLRAIGLVTVSAPSLDDLERSVAVIEQAAVQSYCETRRLWGQQAQVFTVAALPLCHSANSSPLRWPLSPRP
ncbi:SCO6880 family protein [Xylanimonas protaetiae]|uniref:PrgI family protein n=1 Tax=Xylanimonas protaetiae TaxID=2509457 RepID=A0A4P6F3L6_9MICO|nr:SCO6880 family protein [Xylanimonas protaetiae]QAY68779.1 PrgI family protein [Xylanimonas protaetiae]